MKIKNKKFVVILLLFLIFLCACYILIRPTLVNSTGGLKSVAVMRSPIAVREAIYYINRIFEKEYEITKTYPKTTEELIEAAFRSSDKDFFRFYNVKSPKDGKISKIDKKYLRSSKNENGIDEQLAQTPCIVAPFSISYFISSFKNECRRFDLENPENSDCWLTVDLNWYEKPNRFFVYHNLSGKKLYYTDDDQFILVIKHLPNDDNKLVPVLPRKYNPYIKGVTFQEI